MGEVRHVIIVGAGPYGLSVAAHLRARGIPYLIYGQPMETWSKHMPAGMYLKSPWGVASSLSDPARHLSLDRYLEAHGRGREGPIPLDLFLDYGRWFRERAVPDVESALVERIDLKDGVFGVHLSDRRLMPARRVVVATGLRRFADLPSYALGLPGELVSHTIEHSDLARFRGKDVAVVGAGQSGLEYAALLHEAGAGVELIVRAPAVTWIHHKFWNRGVAKRVLYAPTDVGPLGLSWLIAYPLVYRNVPRPRRHRLDARAVHPAGAHWLRHRVEGRVRTTLGTAILEVRLAGGRLDLRLSDGTTRRVEHLFLATGFRPQLDRLSLLGPTLRARIATSDGMPRLDNSFQSSVPGLHFAGALATGDLGALFRFVAGADITARCIARAAAGRPIE